MTSEQQSEDHLTPGDVFEELVVEALEHGDGGDGGDAGAPPSKSRRAAKLVTAFGLVLGGAAVFFVIRRFVHDWPLVQPELDDANWGWIGLAGLCALGWYACFGGQNVRLSAGLSSKSERNTTMPSTMEERSLFSIFNQLP